MKTQSISRKGTHKTSGQPSLFTRFRGVFMPSWMRIVTKLSALIPSNIYHSCRSTPLSVFIECLVFERYHVLIKYGFASKTKIVEAWETLLMEYYELSGDEVLKLLVDLSKNIGILQGKILSYKLSIYVLRYKDSPECAGILRRGGFDVSDLDKVEKGLKSYEFELKSRIKEYENLLKSNDGKKVSEGYFDEMLVELSKFMGYRIDPENTTVLEFIKIRGRHKKEVDALNKKRGK